MKELLKKLVVPVATYAVLRGGEAVISGIRTWRKNAKEKESKGSK